MQKRNEELIFVNVLEKPICSECEHGTSEECYLGECWYPYRGHTRSELVERMAKAMCNQDFLECAECSMQNEKIECKLLLKSEGFLDKSEAALDAILKI